ncbi:hypothetical protein [Roseovarius aestuarii]|uniref:hypothetical protein n=1 Tax=Roseovarius aestuarii TaxID=475083 RepID=UPI00111C140F|nr:hypothetical protein [Roseovarius aestuarii]
MTFTRVDYIAATGNNRYLYVDPCRADERFDGGGVFLCCQQPQRVRQGAMARFSRVWGRLWRW